MTKDLKSVRMKVDISGTRNGVDWPRRGEVADLPAQEAADLVTAGMAEYATPAKGNAGTATAPADEETRPPIRTTARVGRPRAPRAKPAAKPAEPTE